MQFERALESQDPRVFEPASKQFIGILDGLEHHDLFATEDAGQ